MQTKFQRADTPSELDQPEMRAGRTEFIVNVAVTVAALLAIAAYVALRAADFAGSTCDLPLIIGLFIGGPVLLVRLIRKVIALQFGSDLLAGISIVTAAVLGQYLAGMVIVLMLSGGEWLEAYARRTASGALRALARRMPTSAHRWDGGALADVELSAIRAGDLILVMPHEVCPADGVVSEGRGSMDESYLTGEPYGIAKAVGSEVLSGALNGASALTVRVLRAPADSRYARITQVMREAEARRIKLQRLGDTIGAWFTPVAVAIAIAAWLIAGDPLRFLSVLVVATPCPLILAIPVAIIGTISLCARRGIIIRDAGILEHLERCRTVIFDKTGTLTIGQPRLAEILGVSAIDSRKILQYVASLEQYSRHPLAPAVLAAAKTAGTELLAVEDVHEPPGFGLRARIDGHDVVLTGRKHLSAEQLAKLPPAVGGLECIMLFDGAVAAAIRFRDEPREDLRRFVDHLAPQHKMRRAILLTGDRAIEAGRIAKLAGIETVMAEKSPEEKLQIVREETARAPTLFVGDGVNDAPALMAATVGIALGAGTDVAAAAAGAVILAPSLRKIDELAHISRRTRRIVLQSAVGGMVLSLVAIGFAAMGHLPPVAGAVVQEVIDLAAILNAMRAAFAPRKLTDM